MIIAVLFTVIFIVILYILLGKPKKHKINNINNLNSYINSFLDQLIDGSVFIITHKKSKKFVQFTKRSDKNNNPYLLFGFPDAPWSRNIFPKIMDRFDEDHIHYSIKGTGDDTVTRFLEVDKIKTNPEAIKIVKSALSAMDLNYYDTFICHYEGKTRPNALEVTIKGISQKRYEKDM